MKIFEFEDSAGGDLLERNRTSSLDRSTKWDRPASAPARSSPSNSIVSNAERRTINLGTSSKLKLNVLDLGRLRLDKNFMVANSTLATARNPNPRGQVIDIPVSACYIERADGNILFDTGCNPSWGRSERTMAGRRLAGTLSAYRRRGVPAARAARHDGRRAGRCGLCRSVTPAL